MGKGYDEEKNLFYKGLKMENGMIVFNTEESHSLPHITDIIVYYNRLLRENKELKKKCYGYLDGLNYYQEQNGHISERLSDLEEENEHLKQRNDRQAKRLAELYELMAKKDWESLTEIIDDFCSCEKQLQRESGTYSDWND